MQEFPSQYKGPSMTPKAYHIANAGLRIGWAGHHFDIFLNPIVNHYANLKPFTSIGMSLDPNLALYLKYLMTFHSIWPICHIIYRANSLTNTCSSNQKCLTALSEHAK